MGKVVRQVVSEITERLIKFSVAFFSLPTLARFEKLCSYLYLHKRGVVASQLALDTRCWCGIRDDRDLRQVDSVTFCRCRDDGWLGYLYLRLRRARLYFGYRKRTKKFRLKCSQFIDLHKASTERRDKCIKNDLVQPMTVGPRPREGQREPLQIRYESNNVSSHPCMSLLVFRKAWCGCYMRQLKCGLGATWTISTYQLPSPLSTNFLGLSELLFYLLRIVNYNFEKVSFLSGA